MVKLVARSRPMRQVLEQARRYAAVDANVLITGETGVGKNALASFLHHRSPRRRHPFITVDCPGLPATLVESELFGHERGAFTDATATRRGRFEMAGNGTVYLDAVSALTPGAQGALLRIVEERRAVRLGGTATIDLRARLIASAGADLEARVQTGTFRVDLFHRLRVLTLSVPPLRERRDDVIALATGLLATIAGGMRRQAPVLSPAAADALIEYPWPGNVRELRHVLERTLIGGVGDVIDASALPLDVLGGRDAYLPRLETTRPTLAEVERRYIQLTLQHTGGSQTRAATILGISRKNLWEKRKRYAME